MLKGITIVYYFIRLEHATNDLEGHCSIQLSYGPCIGG